MTRPSSGRQITETSLHHPSIGGWKNTARTIYNDFSLAAQLANPFDGTALAPLLPTNYTWDLAVNGNGKTASDVLQHLTIQWSEGSDEGIKLPGLTLKGEHSLVVVKIGNDHASLRATTGAMGSYLDVSGDVDLTTGAFDLKGDTSGMYGKISGEVAYNYPFTSTKQVNGHLQTVTTRETFFTVDLEKSVNLSYHGYGVKATIDVSATYNFTEQRFYGDVAADASIDYGGHHYAVGVGADFNFSVGTYSIDLDFDIRFRVPSIGLIPGFWVNLGHYKKSITV